MNSIYWVRGVTFYLPVMMNLPKEIVSVLKVELIAVKQVVGKCN